MTILALSHNETTKALAKFLDAQSISVIAYEPYRIQPLAFDLDNVPWANIQHVVVTSPNAVAHGFKKILPKLNPTAPIFTIGAITAQYIQHLCKNPLFYPTVFTSEALLAMKAFESIKDTYWTLIKGDGGRDLIEKTLLERGAIVYTIPCYQREIIEQDLTEQYKVWRNKHVTECLVTSAEGFDFFCRSLPKEGKTWLQQLTFIVTSERLQKHIQTKGFENIRLIDIFSSKHFFKESLYDRLN